MDFFDGTDKAACWIFFLLATFITQITFLNMLIAVMGDTYAKVTETKDQNALCEKIKIMADYVRVVHNTEKEHQYLVLTKPSDADDGDSWEGTVATVRKSLDKAVADMGSIFTKRFGAITMEVSNLNGQLSAQNDRVGSLQSNIQKQAVALSKIQTALKTILKGKPPIQAAQPAKKNFLKRGGGKGKKGKK